MCASRCRYQTLKCQTQSTQLGLWSMANKTSAILLLKFIWTIGALPVIIQLNQKCQWWIPPAPSVFSSLLLAPSSRSSLWPMITLSLQPASHCSIPLYSQRMSMMRADACHIAMAMGYADRDGGGLLLWSHINKPAWLSSSITTPSHPYPPRLLASWCNTTLPSG